jgi:hypothetical protein
MGTLKNARTDFLVKFRARDYKERVDKGAKRGIKSANNELEGMGL